MKRSGFTLIELVFVIVILGILAAVAVPRLTTVTDDAKIAAEKGVVGGVRGGIAAAHGAWLVKSTTLSEGALKNALGWTPNAAGYPIDLENNDTNTSSIEIKNPIGSIFGCVMSDPVDGWKEVAAGKYEGPASNDTSGVPDTTGNDINKSGRWSYEGNSSFVYVKP